MKEYHKIETLFKFNQETKKHDYGKFYNPTVELLKNHDWLFTEKIDGTNFRIHWNGHKLTYAGRTDNATFSNEQIKYINNNLVNENTETLFEQMFMEKKVTIYGELYGVKIQSGGLYVNGKGINFKAFDVEIDNVFLTYDNAKEVAKKLGYDFVPIVLIGNVEQGLEYTKSNTKSTFSEAKLEGLVGKPLGDLRDRLGKRIVIKIKKRDLEK